MAKIRVELEVPNDEYCDSIIKGCCPMCQEGNWGKYYCSLFGELEVDANNGYYCKRCDKCKQAEVKE